MTTLKKGNIAKHAKTGQKIVFGKKKPAVKRKAAAKKTVAKKTVARKVVKRKTPAVKKFAYIIDTRATATTLWKPLLGSDSKARVIQLAKLYAKNYPRHYFRVRGV